MKIIQINVRDLDSFLNKFIDSNYKVEYRIHVVLTDCSELVSIKVKKENTDVLVLIAHYITQNYLSKTIGEHEDRVNTNTCDKTSSVEWRIPVNPVIAIVLDNRVMNILSNYRDNYPVDNGEELVNRYRGMNPGYRDVPKLLLARILEELRGED